MCAACITISCTVVGKLEANLFLSGDLVGVFRGGGGANIDIDNFDDGSASFRTGIATGNSFRSGVTFTAESFAGIGEGDSVSLGSLSFYNGITQIGTSSHSAVLDLYLRLADVADNWIHLSTLNFAIDATLNAKGLEVPDNFLAGYISPENVLVGGKKLEFSITGLPATTAVAENSKVDIGNLILTLGPSIPVTERGSSALYVALGLGMVALGHQVAGRKFLWKPCDQA